MSRVLVDVLLLDIRTLRRTFPAGNFGGTHSFRLSLGCPPTEVRVSPDNLGLWPLATSLRLPCWGLCPAFPAPVSPRWQPSPRRSLTLSNRACKTRLQTTALPSSGACKWSEGLVPVLADALTHRRDLQARRRPSLHIVKPVLHGLAPCFTAPCLTLCPGALAVGCGWYLGAGRAQGPPRAGRAAPPTTPLPAPHARPHAHRRCWHANCWQRLAAAGRGTPRAGGADGGGGSAAA